MIRKKRILLLSLISLICVACSAKGDRSTASLRIARANSSLQLERVCIHDFLAEYDRHLVLNVEGSPVAQVQISTDTGGMSRANVFFRETDSILIVQDGMGRYEVDVVRRNIREVNQECNDPKGGVFVGAFDVDESKEWRFIPAAERKQAPMSVSGCGEI